MENLTSVGNNDSQRVKSRTFYHFKHNLGHLQIPENKSKQGMGECKAVCGLKCRPSGLHAKSFGGISFCEDGHDESFKL